MVGRQEKTADELSETDLRAFPVWQFVNADGRRGEVVLRPVKKVPVGSLSGRLVGTEVGLANGATAWALLGNVDVTSQRLTGHFLTISVLRNGAWFAMARYHDPDYSDRGPEALAAFLGMRVEDVFPIAYDLRQVCAGPEEVLVGTIEREPRERLTRAQLIALAIP